MAVVDIKVLLVVAVRCGSVVTQKKGKSVFFRVLLFKLLTCVAVASERMSLFRLTSGREASRNTLAINNQLLHGTMAYSY
jgi:hypothetical protein